MNERSNIGNTKKKQIKLSLFKAHNLERVSDFIEWQIDNVITLVICTRSN